MKIAFVCEEYPPLPAGGIGTVTYTLAHGMRKAGHEVTVVGLGQSPFSREDDGVRVVSLRMTRYRGFSWLLDRWRLARWLSRSAAAGEIEVIEVPDYYGRLPFPVAVAPVIVRLHHSATHLAAEAGSRASLSVRLSETSTVRTHRWWIGVSRHAVEQTQRTFGVTPIRSCVVYNPVRISRKLNGTEVDSPPDYLLFAGQVTRRKGVLAVATAAKAFMHEFPNLHLVFAGPVGHDGAVPTDDRIRSILDWRLAQRVHFLGRIPWDILQLWMANARALLFPSTLEFCPMVVAEAMANRCPVLVADGPPFTEYLTHERDALLIPANDPQALAAAARRLLLDSALRAWLVDNAYETSRRVFGLQNCLMKSLAFYELAREQWGQRRSN